MMCVCVCAFVCVIMAVRSTEVSTQDRSLVM